MQDTKHNLARKEWLSKFGKPEDDVIFNHKGEYIEVQGKEIFIPESLRGVDFIGIKTLENVTSGSCNIIVGVNKINS